jgi:aminoglycoside phosphotransferase family enzyme/predicted kinase
MPASSPTGDHGSTHFLAALLEGEPFREASALRVIETHISWVILTGQYAYKIKKPLDLGFLNFSSLEARRAACEEELRLNRRLAPDIYLGVLPITRSAGRPVLGGAGPIVDYAVKMRQFPPDAVLAEVPATGLTVEDMDQLGTTVAEFHQSLTPAAPGEPWGTADAVRRPLEESLAQIARLAAGPDVAASLARTREFCNSWWRSCSGLLEQRRNLGFIRECHGDLHLGNLVRFGGRIVPFDALEFDPALRWIDVMNEAAFLVMDLEAHGRRDLAFHFLNRYLAVTGDYAGLPVLPLYLAYRALVRAKVRLLIPGEATPQRRAMVETLLRYAADPLAETPARLILMCGVSGSGKTWASRALADSLPAIHLRSDVERKRLVGLPELARTKSAVAGGIYAPEVSRRTYDVLARFARLILAAGFSVIVDAASLRREQRRPFVDVARAAGRIAAIVHCTADRRVLADRVLQRLSGARDASEADTGVLARQLEVFQPPRDDEADAVIRFDTGATASVNEIARQIGATARQPD